MDNNYLILKFALGVTATFALYSVLFRENKFYRFFEHVFLGLAAGYTVVVIWKDTLYTNWWQKMVGIAADGTTAAIPGHWIYIGLLPIAFMGYLIFSRKHNWMSKIPVGIILGVWSGQQVQIWWNTYGPQIYSSMLPIVPTTFDSVTVPATYSIVNGEKVELSAGVPEEAARLAEISANLYMTQALTNLIFVVTVVSALSYFLFSFDLKSKWLKGVNTFGRWMLMIGFGAIFGSTVMARFALVIDRMAFVWQEFLPLLLGGS